MVLDAVHCHAIYKTRVDADRWADVSPTCSGAIAAPGRERMQQEQLRSRFCRQGCDAINHSSTDWALTPIDGSTGQNMTTESRAGWEYGIDCNIAAATCSTSQPMILSWKG